MADFIAWTIQKRDKEILAVFTDQRQTAEFMEAMTNIAYTTIMEIMNQKPSIELEGFTITGWYPAD